MESKKKIYFIRIEIFVMYCVVLGALEYLGFLLFDFFHFQKRIKRRENVEGNLYLL